MSALLKASVPFANRQFAKLPSEMDLQGKDLGSEKSENKCLTHLWGRCACEAETTVKVEPKKFVGMNKFELVQSGLKREGSVHTIPWTMDGGRVTGDVTADFQTSGVCGSQKGSLPGTLSSTVHAEGTISFTVEVKSVSAIPPSLCIDCTAIGDGECAKVVITSLDLKDTDIEVPGAPTVANRAISGVANMMEPHIQEQLKSEANKAISDYVKENVTPQMVNGMQGQCS